MVQIINGLKSKEVTIEDAYRYCEDVTRQSSTSFLRSFRHLPSHKRRSVYAMYAFCRRVDDVVDGDWLPNLDYLSAKTLTDLENKSKDRAISLSVKKQQESVNDDLSHFKRVRTLQWFRDNLERIENKEFVSHPIFIALQDTLDKFPINIDHLYMLIEGMEDDLFPTNYRTFEEVRSYCFKVASTVGLSLIEIYGYSNPDAREHAEEMGIFLQMVNILRDIEEDYKKGRIYLPTEELTNFGIDFQNLDNPELPKKDSWKAFMKHYIFRTKVHRDNAINLIPLLNRGSRTSPSIICSVYSEILSEAENRNGDVLSRKLNLGFVKKIGFGFSLLGIWK
jgi:phytoene synthase